MTIRNRLLVAATAALLVASPWAHADDAALLRAVVGSEAEAKGDFDAWLAELTDAVARDPESPYASAALLKIRAVCASAGDPTVVEKALDPVLTRGVRDGDNDEDLRQLLQRRADSRGDFAAGKRYAGSRGYLHRFAVAGPFGRPGAAYLRRRFAPESHDLDPAASMDGTWGAVRWLPLPVHEDSAWITPGDQIRRANGQGIAYALARVKTASPRIVALKAYCRDSFAVFVDGEATILADRERDPVPDVVWATARLAAGWNRILIKIAGSNSFALKLCDPATGLSLTDVEEGDPMGGTECPDPGGDPEARTYRTPAERAAESAHGDAGAAAAAAYLLDEEGRRWEAYTAFEAAAKGADGGDKTRAANVHAAFGRFLSSFRELPAVQRKLRAKEQFNAAVAAFPAHNSAAVRLAEYLDEDDHPDQALKALREQIKARPTASAQLAMARICRGRGFEREAIDAANEAARLAPRSAEAQHMLRDVAARYGNAEGALSRTKRLLEIDSDDASAAADLAARLRAQGRQDDALALVRQWAARQAPSPSWRTNEAQILTSLSRDDEALAVWRELAKQVPQEEQYPREIARILERRGDKAGAIESYRRAIECEPFQPQLWRALARLQGTEVDFGAAFEPDVNDLLAKLPSTEELKKRYPKAVAVTVLDHDVTRVRADGSALNWIHMIYKILDENGVKKYATLPRDGELLEVRAILPDGRVMAPTGVPGRPYDMEGLVPGTVIELRYLTSQGPTPRGFDGVSFAFQDTEVRDEPNPVLLSRWVVVSPDSMRLDPVKRNYDGDPTVETKDGWVTTVWEKRDLARIEPERNMPGIEEIAAQVEYMQSDVAEDLAWQVLGSRDDTRPTPLLAEVVSRVVKDGMDDVAKVRALFDFVNDEITGDRGGREGPTATLLEKSGDRAQLLEALIRAASVPYRRGRAMDRRAEDAAASSRQAASAFSGPFLWIEPKGGQPFALFVRGRLAPFALVPEEYRGSAAFLEDDAGGSIVRLDEGGPDVHDGTRFEIVLGGDEKSTKLTGVETYRGADDYDVKKQVIEAAEDDRRKYVERELSRWFAHPTLDKFDFPDLEKRGAPYQVRVAGTMTNYLVPQGDAYVVALGLPATGMTGRFVDRSDRTYDLVLRVREDHLDELTIKLSDAFRVKKLPEDHVVLNRVGAYSLTWRLRGDVIEVRREVHLHPARYRADEYKAFVAWCKAVDDAEDRKLELTKVK